VDALSKNGELITNGAAVLAQHANVDYINDIIQKINSDSSQFTEDVVDFPVSLVRNMFQGEFLQTFEVPYYNDTYLFAHGANEWARGGLDQLLGTKLGQFANKNMSLDVPTTPTWKNVNGGGEPPEITSEFTLWNKDLESLKANYKFIHALISGAYWSQIKFNQKSPNLYDIEVPGRFHHYYCTMDCELKYMGKSRTLQPSALAELINSLGSEGNQNKMTMHDDYMFPDAYSVKVVFKSLMPNNFNMYLDYLLKGSGEQGFVERLNQTSLAFSAGGHALDQITNGVQQGVNATTEFVTKDRSAYNGSSSGYTYTSPTGFGVYK
jgi:hypothetical protein